MTHEYQVAGMTCDNCSATVKSLLEKVPGVRSVTVARDPGRAVIVMDHHVGLTALQRAMQGHPRYQITEAAAPPPAPAETEAPASFWGTYKPILLVFAYILGVTLLIEMAAGAFDWMRAMRHFMAGFFLVFSFFKLLDVPGFALAYGSYDLVARRWPGWGYVYPVVELGLGILYLLDFQPFLTNALTFGVMGVSTLGVVQSLRAKRRFQCACLGAVFNLPMSTLTLVEDALMVGMAGVMLVVLAN